MKNDSFRPLEARPVDGLLRPIQEFMKLEASSGILLIGMAVLAMIPRQFTAFLSLLSAFRDSRHSWVRGVNHCQAAFTVDKRWADGSVFLFGRP